MSSGLAKPIIVMVNQLSFPKKPLSCCMIELVLCVSYCKHLDTPANDKIVSYHKKP